MQTKYPGLSEEAYRNVQGWMLLERQGMGALPIMGQQAALGINRSAMLQSMVQAYGGNFTPGTPLMGALSGQMDQILDTGQATQFQIGFGRWAPIASFAAQRGVDAMRIQQMGAQLGPTFAR